MTLNLFHGTGLFLCPLKTPENFWISATFQKVYKKTSKGIKISLTNMSAEHAFLQPIWSGSFNALKMYSFNVFLFKLISRNTFQ